MLKDWSYEGEDDPLPEETEFPDDDNNNLGNLSQVRGMENDLIDLENIAKDVLHNLFQELKKRNGKKKEVQIDVPL